MEISLFQETGLKKIEKFIRENECNLDNNTVRKILSTSNISFAAERINRLQSTLLCELKDSYVQQSQRYVSMKEDGFDLPDLDKEDKLKAVKLINDIFELYSKMSELKEGNFKGRPKVDNYKYGIPIEDARYILPLASKTNLFISMSGDKLFDLYKLINKEEYISIFCEFKSKLNLYIPKSILKYLDCSSNDNDNAVEVFYEKDFEKINDKNKMIHLDSFEQLDFRVGLGALTSTQTKTPSQIVEKWGENAYEKTKAVEKRVLGYGHESIAEQARTTFGMMCSMVTYHQQIRHRLSSNHREALKKLILEVDRNAVVPETIKKSEFYSDYLKIVDEIKRLRMYVYEKYGMDKALYFILNADQIKVIISTNARMDSSILSERICMNAQWEIRELSEKKLMILREISDVLYEKALPSCVHGACKEGKLTCGNALEVRKKFLNE